MNKKLLIFGMIAIFSMGQSFPVSDPSSYAVPTERSGRENHGRNKSILDLLFGLGVGCFAAAVAYNCPPDMGEDKKEVNHQYVVLQMPRDDNSKNSDQQADSDGKGDLSTVSDVKAIAMLAGLLVVIGLGVQ